MQSSASNCTLNSLKRFLKSPTINKIFIVRFRYNSIFLGVNYAHNVRERANLNKSPSTASSLAYPEIIHRKNDCPSHARANARSLTTAFAPLTKVKPRNLSLSPSRLNPHGSSIYMYIGTRGAQRQVYGSARGRTHFAIDHRVVMSRGYIHPVK